MSNTPSRNDFAQSDEEARQRFELFESKDPLQEIRPALLNSADIFDYVRLTGMIWPFDPNPVRNKLKSASYEVDFMGDLHLVRDSKSYEKKEVRKGEDYHLPKNSISFLFLETTFCLPDYIAARFNLRIKHVHAGLLLGTGPLVDPGFAGRILIPLHNLTSEDYVIRGGEGLIWVEFTKLSENKRWNSTCSREGEYRRFPGDHRYLPASKYFEKASPRGVPVPASSSIPEAIRTSVQSAKKATKLVKTLFSVGILTIVAIVISSYMLVMNANKNVADASKNISDYRENQVSLEKRLGVLESELKELRAAKKVPSSAQKSP